MPIRKYKAFCFIDLNDGSGCLRMETLYFKAANGREAEEIANSDPAKYGDRPHVMSASSQGTASREMKQAIAMQLRFGNDPIPFHLIYSQKGRKRRRKQYHAPKPAAMSLHHHELEV
ncbi:hypothetical protein LUCX_207 [Xanthomonas phage vB_XciM_LucasX]|nr:hypothetical protein LUCX_207 [Xanthomonas phage vB_XciM_LucasX]